MSCPLTTSTLTIWKTIPLIPKCAKYSWKTKVLAEASRLVFPLTTLPPRQIKEKPVAPIKTVVAIGQICVGAASKSLFVVVNETDYSPSVSCLSGLSVWDSVGDRPVGLDQSSSLLIASTETTDLLAPVVKTIRSEQPDSPNLISANWISCSGDNFEPNKTPNSHRLTCGQQGSLAPPAPLENSTGLQDYHPPPPPNNPLIFPNYDSYAPEIWHDWESLRVVL